MRVYRVLNKGRERRDRRVLLSSAAELAMGKAKKHRKARNVTKRWRQEERFARLVSAPRDPIVELVARYAYEQAQTFLARRPSSSVVVGAEHTERRDAQH
jgi:anti-sigma-K factor RskA